MVARPEGISLLPDPAASLPRMWGPFTTNARDRAVVPDEQAPLQPCDTEEELPLTLSFLEEVVDKKAALLPLFEIPQGVLQQRAATPKTKMTKQGMLISESDFPDMSVMVAEGTAAAAAAASLADHKRKRASPDSNEMQQEDQAIGELYNQASPTTTTTTATAAKVPIVGKRKRNRPTVQQQKEARDKRLKEIDVRNVFLRNLVTSASAEIEELKKGVIAILRKEGKIP